MEILQTVGTIALIMVFGFFAFASGWVFSNRAHVSRWFYAVYAVGFLLASIGQVGCSICTLIGFWLAICCLAGHIVITFFIEYKKKALGKEDPLITPKIGGLHAGSATDS